MLYNHIVVAPVQAINQQSKPQRRTKEWERFDFILEYVLSAMIGVMSYWFARGKALPAEELVALMHDLMESGVIGRLSSKNH